MAVFECPKCAHLQAAEGPGSAFLHGKVVIWERPKCYHRIVVGIYADGEMPVGGPVSSRQSYSAAGFTYRTVSAA